MSRSHEQHRLLTLVAAAIVLRVSTHTLLRVIQLKKVPALKVGGQWRIRESRFKKWVGQKENMVFELGKK